MTKRMLIDATHQEETRVAVVDGNRLEEFDYESKVRKQLKGSIFLAKVTRVEPSLQAAFVNFGGNRHGFLPFSEIHPDYFRIPIADREALIAEQEAEMEARKAEEEAADEAAEKGNDNTDQDDEDVEDDVAELGGEGPLDEDLEDEDDNIGNRKEEPIDPADDAEGNTEEGSKGKSRGRGGKGRGGQNKSRGGRGRGRNNSGGRKESRNNMVEIVGGDIAEGEEVARPKSRRNYKIQEVVKRGQIMLIQVSKEERGNKGAAVTTYLSLPGRYCVLMPNSPRGGGVSRKIANFKDRRKMRDLLASLEVPSGMSVIMRTAGVARNKTEIKRDLDYLKRLWDNIRELTLSSTAPSVVHEEGHLIRRSIRDIYTRDVEEVLVSGDEGYKKARDFMKMMIPSHAKNVKQYKDEKIPLFHRYQVENQISSIGDIQVTLKSGGYLIINPTEALVSVDVNSGRATKERHIEETALKTNLEAASEVARQLRLRDLGGLVVIDFIDMEDRRNNRKVENKLRDALSTDRARIQVGRISTFGLLELSRQRLNPSLTEAQFEKCSHCDGTGTVRTIDNAAITALRALEDEGIKGRAGEIKLAVSNDLAIYILNNKREMLNEIENRYGFKVLFHVDNEIEGASFSIEATQGGNNKQQSKDNNSGSGDDNKDEQSEKRGGRRRGRRGGRRRNRDNRDDNENSTKNDQDAGSDAQDDKKSDQKNEASDDKKSDDKPKKTTKRSPRKASSKSATKDDKKEDSKASKKGDDSDKEDQKPATGRKKTTSKSEDKESKDAKNEKAEEKATAKKPAAKKAPAKSSPAKKPAAKKTAGKKASNDDGGDEKPYETVNEAPKSKKSGWWGKKK